MHRVPAMLLLVSLALAAAASEARDAEAPAGLTRFTFPQAREVFIAGEFNGWNATATPMHRDSTGQWFVDLPLQPGKYQYKFVADGQWVHDTANPESVDDGWNGKNSVMTVPAPPPAAGAPPAAAEPPRSRYIAPVKELPWTHIRYPDIPIPGTSDMQMMFSIRPNGFCKAGDPPSFLSFEIEWQAEHGTEVPTALQRPEEFVVRLHRANAEPIEPHEDDGESWGGAGSAGWTTYQRTHFFPWAANTYEEAWVECRLREHVYWFEIPYGFTRNPAEPLPPDEPEQSGPTFAAAMRHLPPTDKIIPWLHVEYEWGKIQNNWHLKVRLANSWRAAAEIQLHHNPGEHPGRWSLATPDTSISIKRTGHHDMDGVPVARYLRGSLHRADAFQLGSAGGPGRDHAVVTVQVDEQSYAFPVPSSLYKYGHASAESEHQQRVSRGDGLFEQILRLAP